MKRNVTTVLAGAALSVAAVFSIGTGPASAAPTGCSPGGGGVYATAKCSGGNGWYQAYAVCMNPAIPGATFYKFVEGPWKKAKSGETSTVWCPLLYVVSSRGVGVKN
ncbi:hypothetical protein ABH922_001859 [Rhodococcus sp. 27YEA15]|uniref:hypothetical protein n=1 Tax=Rhodococcus sp. 27YEA15 TaxID=3156259 RepID=UPI003C7A652B